MNEVQIAPLVYVDGPYVGHHLLTDAATGATVLQMTNVFEYDEDGGGVQIDGTDYAYTGIDPFAETLTLATPLAADAIAGTPAWSLDEQGRLEEQWKVWVDLDSDPESDAVPCYLDTSLIGDFPEGDDAKGQLVQVELRDDGEYYVTSRPFQRRSLDGTVIRSPGIYAAKLADSPILDNTWTVIDGLWIVKGDRVTYDSGTARFMVTEDGEYDLRCGATFSSGGAGRRGLRIHFYGFGVDAGTSRIVRVAGDSGVIGLETAQIHTLYAGMEVAFEAWQDSGGTLDVKGSDIFTARAVTDCSVRWVGPLA